MEHLLRATAAAESRHFWFRGFRAFVTPLIRRATAGTSSPRILDCGCGTGANLERLGRFGRAYGCDLSETGLRLAREAGRHDLVRASVAAAPFRSESFDLVTSFDVLYSLDPSDEHAAVSEMYRLLTPRGFAIVNVAAMKGLTGDHSVLSHERRRYSRASLRQLLTYHGFTVVRLTYTNATLFPPLAVIRALQRRRGLASESEAQWEMTVPVKPINGALTALLYLESLWLRRFDEPFGSSLLCLAQKTPAIIKPARSGM
jgi:SAM-dependent methyltransferase